MKSEDNIKQINGKVPDIEITHTGDDDSVEEHLKHVAIIEAPDGGYGWIVLVSAFFCNVIVDGIVFTSPEALLPLWELEYSSMSLACALLAGCYLLVGPFASILANIYGCNKVAIFGSFLASLGFLLSAIAQHQLILFLTFGIIAGIFEPGLGFVFLAAVISVSTYFNKRRALATGISFCGSGIGTAVISLLNPWILGSLLNENWRLYCIFLSILSLTLAFFGYFFKPLQPTEVQLDEVTKITNDYLTRHENPEEHEVDNIEDRKDSLIQNLPRHSATFSSSKHLGAGRPFLSTIELNISRQGDKAMMSQQNLAQMASKTSMSELNRPLSKIDIFYTGSTKHLNERKKSIVAKSIVEEEPRNELFLSQIGLPTAEDYEDTGFHSWFHKYVNQLKSFLDVSLLHSPSFVILAIGGFLTLAAFFIPFMYIQQFALSKGIAKTHSKYLVTIMGLVNTVGRVLCGGIADSPKVDPLHLSNILTILGGLATMALPFFDHFYAFVAYCVIFALGVASFAALRSVISADLLGMERLTNAYGFLMLFMGVAALIGPPFASFLRNQTGSFAAAFVVMGSFMTLSGIISLPLRKINRWERKRDGTDDSEKSNHIEMQPLNKA